MYSKKYMYDAGRKTCIKLIQDGYVHTFEEILSLLNLYQKVKEKAEHGLDRTMPRDFKKERECFLYIEDKLKKAEEAMRKGALEDNYRSRMQLGEYFHGLEGYQWLAEYFYKSTQLQGVSDVRTDVKLNIITSLQQQALLEESRGNTDIATKYLEKALRVAKKNSVGEDEPSLKPLNEHLCRMYQQLGIQHLEKESHRAIDVEKSVSVKFFKKAAKLAATSDLEIQAACEALMGKAMLKFNNDELALKYFESYTELSEKCNNQYGVCQGYFAISEIFKRSCNLDKSIIALNKCQQLAKEHSFDIPFIFSSISLGKIETAKKKYFIANEHFEKAHNATMASTKDYVNRASLKKISKVMYGIGKAHLSFSKLIASLQSPTDFSMLKLFSWKQTGGPFTGEITEPDDHLIDLDEVEDDNRDTGITLVIEELMKHELHQE